MNILFTSSRSFKDAGGVGRVTEILAAELQERGYKVLLLSFSSGNGEDINGILQYAIPDPQNILSLKNKVYISQFLMRYNIQVIINQSSMNFMLIKALKNAKPSTCKLVTVHHNCIKCYQENYKHIIAQSHGQKLWFPLVNNPLVFRILLILHRIKYARFFKIGLSASQAYILLSKKFSPELKYYLKNFNEDKIKIIPNPAPFEGIKSTNLQKKENRLLFVGRIDFVQKKVNLLLELWENLENQYTDWHFDVVGKGSALEELRNKSEILKLNRIYFHGYQNPIPFLKKAKIFCMTSAFEGFPMAIVEAQMFGVVPITFSSFSSVDDLIKNDVTGITIPPFNMPEYISKLSSLMKDERKRGEMAKKAIASTKKYSISNIADRWIDVLKEL